MPAGRKERKIMKIYYQHPNTWFGDCMPFGKDDTFYLFHQSPVSFWRAVWLGSGNHKGFCDL